MQIDAIGGDKVQPHDARVAAPFLALWEPKYCISSPSFLISSFLWTRALRKHFMKQEYWFPPGNSFSPLDNMEGFVKYSWLEQGQEKIGYTGLTYICQDWNQLTPFWTPLLWAKKIVRLLFLHSIWMIQQFMTLSFLTIRFHTIIRKVLTSDVYLPISLMLFFISVFELSFLNLALFCLNLSRNCRELKYRTINKYDTMNSE